MTTRRRTIGFDRKIRLEWLDATADWVAEGLSPAEIRSRLRELLEGAVAGEGAHSARGKTMTVLLHIWSLVPENLVPLRDDGLELLRTRSGRDRLPLHWGMCVTTYPFFRDVAATTGRLLALQGTATLSQITRRMRESWGDRSTAVRAAQRVVRSWVDWGLLEDNEDPGVLHTAPPIEVNNGSRVGPWLVETLISSRDKQTHPVHSVLTTSVLFPFELCLSPGDLARHPRLAIHRHGHNEDVVALTTSRS